MTSPRLHETRRTRARLRDLKTVPVLPSLITLGNVFLGFLAISKAADALGGNVADPAVIALLELAAILVFCATIFDALDGRVARMTGQTTAFGAQLDSLADVVTFGVAPAFIAKLLINFNEPELLPTHPKVYYFCAAVYVLCAAMRLARFNVETGPSQDEHREFRGLPTPGAAAVICAMIAFYCSREDTNNIITRALLPDGVHEAMVIVMPATLVCVGLLMVSRVPYPHFLWAIVRRRQSFPFLATLVVLIALASVEWQLALLVMTVSYVLIGVGIGVYRLATTGTLEPPAAADEADDGPDPKLN